MTIPPHALTINEANPHLVRLYQNDSDLARGVGAYLVEGLRLNEALIVIATRAHLDDLMEELVLAGYEPSALLTSGQLQVLDAHVTLDAITTGDAVDRSKFHGVIAPPFDNASRGPWPRARAYGEMVDLLWRAGRLSVALRLEGLWNRLRAQRPFTLLCSYRMGTLETPLDLATRHEIYSTHTCAMAGEDTSGIDAAVDRALESLVGAERAAALRPLIQATVRPQQGLGRAERTAFWVRENLPHLSAPLLAEARRLFGTDEG